jgi:hypothetical protein
MSLSMACPGVEVTDTELVGLPLRGRDWHLDWSYDVTPPRA